MYEVGWTGEAVKVGCRYGFWVEGVPPKAAIRNLSSTFHPPSLRRGAPIGQALPVFFVSGALRLPVSGCYSGPFRPRLDAGRRATVQAAVSESALMEITWYGRTCVRIRGRDAVVVADPFPAIVGPTGRGITGDVVTFSHPDDAPPSKAKGRLARDGTTVLPTSLEQAFVLDGPGEYEIKNILLTG